MSLKFVALSGSTGVTENLYVYEYGSDLIAVDCGVGFPESGMHGIDLVIPDFTYLRKNRKRFKALFVTHGHEDHIGAIPFLLKEFQVPVYATQLTAGFIKDKLSEHKLPLKLVKTINPEHDTISVGNFKATPFRISHSIPDAVGFSIDSPEGRIMHVADFKFDWSPVDQKPFDITKLAMLSSGGVLALASDSLGSLSEGATKSEKDIEVKIENIAKKSRGRIFVTTMSSNISRMQQVINVSNRLGRRVCFVGYSMVTKSEIAKNLNLLKTPRGSVIDLKRARRLPENKITYIISGSYGQPESALARATHGTHKFIKIKKSDTVIFSADPSPPGSKMGVDYVVDTLIQKGVDVHYYDLQEDLHVSGHGSQEDIRLLIGITKPKYLFPIGGTIRHNRGFNLLAQKMGHPEKNIFELSPGDVLEFRKGTAKKLKSVSVRTVLVDGLGVGDVGNVVLRDRQILAKEGVVIVTFQLDKVHKVLLNDPDIVSRGFVFEKEEKGFLNFSAQKLKKRLSNKRLDANIIKNETYKFLEQYFLKETGRRPMILPIVIKV